MAVMGRPREARTFRDDPNFLLTFRRAKASEARNK
jgi:hypothetical protein